MKQLSTVSEPKIGTVVSVLPDGEATVTTGGFTPLSVSLHYLTHIFRISRNIAVFLMVAGVLGLLAALPLAEHQELLAICMGAVFAGGGLGILAFVSALEMSIEHTHPRFDLTKYYHRPGAIRPQETSTLPIEQWDEPEVVRGRSG